MRSYEEPIHVLFSDRPRQFIWRGRLLLVKEVQGRWSRSTAWWRNPEPGTGELTREREVWRVEAGNGSHRGVYELAHSVGDEDWVLQAVSD
ncbi:DUF6504 family protein [Tessaracoccus sp. OS52]|uniref:DUF6504 family protein n=1 Tax=Tessaracoccus sp. OS52 TaxID=2886691 RepID=UPI001D10E760|nr:DUF6504 family protein [Tessaracoccus sp. OS52]